MAEKVWWSSWWPDNVAGPLHIWPEQETESRGWWLSPFYSLGSLAPGTVLPTFRVNLHVSVKPP